MEFPYKFPKHADVIAEDAAAYRRLTPARQAERFLGLLTQAAAMRALNGRNHRLIDEFCERAETDWQRAHAEVFANHG